jgi:dephospho-CoA kinase
MLKVAITGGIGSGKSIVCRVFQHLGVPVFFSDKEAKELVNRDPLIRSRLISHFGNDIYLDEGINRKLMASIIFNDPLALQTMNSIVHPVLKQKFYQWTRLQKGCKYVIMEVAILFESKSEKEFDKIITVYAPEDLKIKRSMHRDNCTADEIKERMNNQYDDHFKMQHSDFVIVNDDSTLVLPQILKIHELFFATPGMKSFSL